MQYEAICTGTDGGEVQLTGGTAGGRLSEKGVRSRWIR